MALEQPDPPILISDGHFTGVDDNPSQHVLDCGELDPIGSVAMVGPAPA